MVEVSARVRGWVLRSFPDGTGMRVLEALRELPEAAYGGQDPGRCQAALVLPWGGWRRFEAALGLLRADWRDVLVGSGLGSTDWPTRLDALLGPAEYGHA